MQPEQVCHTTIVQDGKVAREVTAFPYPRSRVAPNCVRLMGRRSDAWGSEQDGEPRFLNHPLSLLLEVKQSTSHFFPLRLLSSLASAATLCDTATALATLTPRCWSDALTRTACRVLSSSRASHTRYLVTTASRRFTIWTDCARTSMHHPENLAECAGCTSPRLIHQGEGCR